VFKLFVPKIVSIATESSKIFYEDKQLDKSLELHVPQAVEYSRVEYNTTHTIEWNLLTFHRSFMVQAKDVELII
jgi:hypothetical protein